MHLAVAGASVQGDASATHDPEDDPFIVRWSWGDGHVDEGVDATHRYEPGVYLLQVEAEDAAGGVATVEHTLEIAAPREPAEVRGESNAAPAGGMAAVALVLVALARRRRR